MQVKQPPIVVAGTNSVVCGNRKTIGFSGNVYGATNQGVWSFLPPATGTFVFGTNSLTPQYQLSVADTTQTQLQFVLTSTNNGVCAAESKTVSVVITKPSIVDAGPPVIPICSNNATVSLNGIVSGTTTGTGVWQSSGSGVFTPNNLSLIGNYVPSGTDLLSGSIWLYLRSTNNGLCLPSVDSLQVIVTEPSLMNAGADINTCSNDPAAQLNGLMTGTTVGSVVWLGGTGSYSPSNAVLAPLYVGSASEIANGFVTLTLTTINNGLCLATQDVIKINFQPKPISNFSVNAVCLGTENFFQDRSLNVSTSGLITNWFWTFGDGSAEVNDASPYHKYANPGNYTAQLVVKNSYNCFDTIQKVAIVSANPTSSFTVLRNCLEEAQKITFNDASFVAAPDNIDDKSYYYDFGGFGFANAKDTAMVFPSDGIFTITHLVTSNKGCQSVYTKTIEVAPHPVARFIYLNNATQGFGATVNFRDTSSNAVRWSWNFGNGTTSNVKNPTVDFGQNGNYSVTLQVADQYSCTSSFSLEVKISNIVTEIIKLIPNVISPNGDGKNDEWRLDFIEVYFPNAEIEIYNRWGEQIFKSIGYSNSWNGTYKGQPLPVGVYYYTINFNDGVSEVVKGSITLLK